jgi:hypothetical protein
MLIQKQLENFNRVGTILKNKIKETINIVTVICEMPVENEDTERKFNSTFI